MAARKYYSTDELAEKWSLTTGRLRTWRYQSKGPKWITLDALGNEHGPNEEGTNRPVRYRVQDVERFERESK